MAHGGDKTERPTEKRLHDARRKGQVAKSHDLTSSLALIAAVAVLWLGGSRAASLLIAAMRDGIAGAASFDGPLDRAVALSVLAGGARTLASALLPLFVTLFIVAALSGYLQVGSIFSFESVKPSLNKLNPAESFKQKFFKGRPYIELLKTVLKMAVAAFVILAVFRSSLRDIVMLVRQPAGAVASFTLGVILSISLKVGIAFVALGVGDYFLQRFLFMREMKMTKQEVKDEWKESEGDPLMKSARRQLHRDILMQNMIAAVRAADVVVANPTHVAVALRYNREEMSAPTVVAKGAELLAAKIREAASEAKVPVVRDVPLARALYELEMDSEIPEELFDAVVVVLRWVYSMKEQGPEVRKDA